MSAASTSGVLVVDKAAGPTSFDVVGVVRHRLGVRRVGHAGTLDPGATGVLPILVGEATKLMPYLAEQDKEYRATVRLGVTTDTQDTSGTVLAECAVPALAVADVERAAARFVGTIRQVPPMYSALHHAGRRLYELAREGVEVERAAREVRVHAIVVEAVALPDVTLRVVCGKGTYIRTLAADLGAALSCGAAVDRLVRTRVGAFTLGEAIASSTLATLPPEDLRRRLSPPASALAGWPAVRLAAAAARAFTNGQAVAVAGAWSVGTLIAVHEGEGRLLGVGEAGPGADVRPVRILHADHPESAGNGG